MTLSLARLTRWGLEEISALTIDEALWWLEGATEFEKTINSN
mgnify:FL=1